MCGILGLLDASGEPYALRDTEPLLRLLQHRGPDGNGAFAGSGILLGHTRLAFLDLSPAGAQPMSTPDGRFTIVFNGEIYNHLEIRTRLPSSIAYKGHSDTETLLHAFATWGLACLDELRGMFAFAVYDRDRGKVVLARDRVGKKPLLYWHDGQRERIAFSSEMRVLTALGAPRDIDAEAVAMYLRVGYIPAPHTIFRSVRKLPASHYLESDGRTVAIRRYHRLKYQPKRVITPEQARHEVRELLTMATKRRLLSDRPLGVLLSGGVDSTAVTAAMARLSREPVQSFAMGFANWGGSELPFAEEVARTLGTDHRSFTISHTSLESLLPALAWHYGEPFGDPSAIPTYCLSSLTRRYVVGALVGDGGDENFMGYRRYRIGRMRERALRVPAFVRDTLARPLDFTTSWRWRRARLAVEGFRGGLDQLFVARTGRFRGVQLRQLLAAPLAEQIGDRDPRSEVVHRLWEEADGPDRGEKMMAVDAQLYMTDQLLVKMDIASMAHGLEVRAPFLDADLMAQAATLPEELKLAGSRHKAVLIDSIAEMPASFFARRKQGFSPPVEKWITGELRDYTREILLDPGAERRGLVRRSTVEDLLRHMDQFPDIAHDIYLLLALEVWAITCLDQDLDAPPRAEFEWSESHMPAQARSVHAHA